MEDIEKLAYNILSGEFVDSEGLLDNILMSKINDRLEDMKADVMESQVIDEGIDVKFDRHINVHGKKPNQSAHAMWMFTHKRSGDVDYNKESEVHQTNGKFSDAKKSAKAWAKKHGHSEVYVMEQTDFEIDEEALDELSKKTLASYATKASSSSHKNSTSNLSSRAAYKLATNGEDDGEKEDRKSFMRSKGIATAIKKLTKENAELMGLELSEEELDELSKKTLGSYINKASRSLRNAEHSDMETFQKRDKGIKNAVDKYTRKKGDKRSVSKTH